MKLVIKKTKMGKGVFAGEAVKTGTLVCMMSGAWVSAREVERLVEVGAVSVDDPFQVGENNFIILDPLPRYFNHHCDPNGGINKNGALVALRDIKKGEELAYDYSSVVCTHCDWQMRCACGSAQCRKVIQNAASIPKTQVKKYIERGVFPAFIKKELLL